MTIIAAADGSALGNPGPAGWAWYIDDTSWRAGGWDHGTNNMGELTAVLNLLESTSHLSEEPLKILCDSQYVINSITKWMPGWKKKGWRKRDGKPVLNAEIMKALDREMTGRTVEFEWVKGHSGHELNEAADERARAMASAYQAGEAEADMPVGPGFRRNGTPARTVVPHRSASEPGPHAEPDLFSELREPDEALVLEDLRGGERPEEQIDPVNRLRELETTLLSPETSDERRMELLHEDLRYVARDGSIAGALEFVSDHRDHWSGTVPETSDSSALALGSGAYHLSYRLTDSSAVTRRSSLWQREDHHNEMGPWLLRYHQVTAEG